MKMRDQEIDWDAVKKFCSEKISLLHQALRQTISEYPKYAIDATARAPAYITVTVTFPLTDLHEKRRRNWILVGEKCVLSKLTVDEKIVAGEVVSKAVAEAFGNEFEVLRDRSRHHHPAILSYQVIPRDMPKK